MAGNYFSDFIIVQSSNFYNFFLNQMSISWQYFRELLMMINIFTFFVEFVLPLVILCLWYSPQDI